MRPRRIQQHLFVASVIALGTIIIVLSLSDVYRDPPDKRWILLTALTLLSGSFTVKLPALSARISVSETFVFVSVLLFGSAEGAITVALDALVISLWMQRTKRSLIRMSFNAAAPAIAIWLSSQAFFALTDAVPGAIDPLAIVYQTLLLLALPYFAINTALVACALGFERDESPFAIWLNHFPYISLSYFVGASVALLLVGYSDAPGVTILWIIVPLIVISYLTYKTSLGRLEDANRHLSQVNDLYISTIETLAMAVDAKDQVTHGHIRRVQIYAMGLAKLLGLTDRLQLRALEAAALLHDMGKLAIPEYILNKPGSLSFAEFSQMKRHAEIGANLLSAIRFPYPVVPIVRHHHENWDGSGYPTGLAGPDIPLGARILAVVDCFDALTSDRPYRPRLSADEAFAMLHSRRGSMYDPLVVDTFVSGYPALSNEVRSACSDMQYSAHQLGGGELPPETFIDIRRNAVQTAALADFERSLSRVVGLSELIGTTLQTVRRLTPASTIAIYRCSHDADVMTCIASGGDPEHLVTGLRIRSGERITGWAAANDKTVANSHAALDLGTVAELFSPPLRSALVTPIKRGTIVLGALALYSTRNQPFAEEHGYALERIGAALSTHRSLQAYPSQNPIAMFPRQEHKGIAL
jgi:putative nucleotidyltransferase with HDIG domain